MNVINSNLAGTMQNAFSIGKRGLTIRQGQTDPNTANLTGTSGDLYVQIGTTPKLYQFRTSSWIDLTGEVFTRFAVTTATYTAVTGDYYLGVRRASGGCTLTLPAGVAGKKYVVKDELGTASPSNPITVVASGTDTIDGGSSITIATGRNSLTFVYGTEWHII